MDDQVQGWLGLGYHHNTSDIVEVVGIPSTSPKEFQTTTSQVVPTGECKMQTTASGMRNIVARGTIYYLSEKQIVHGVSLKGDCYKVSIDEAIKPASFLPIQAGEHKTVGEANKSFVAWPKKPVIFDSKVLEPTSDQHNENQPIDDQQNEEPKHNKRKKDYTNPDGKPKHTSSSYNKMYK
ncbi:putative methyltransferase PMT2 isoform X1 [Iris pallida]|uniref:Methyltransferase PMT2 isoform X1 n=1 Tax=Iris pallida TaxID=29817 RepID=A0AAX6G0N7_IRIPA|nr:putative methyltransferase PMT2 isoform X1 [Iris pallida]KAJ6822037.1 putative methyltransferase PMT2 isoform X1 [Iris pallida]